MLRPKAAAAAAAAPTAAAAAPAALMAPPLVDTNADSTSVNIVINSALSAEEERAAARKAAHALVAAVLAKILAKEAADRCEIQPADDDDGDYGYGYGYSYGYGYGARCSAYGSSQLATSQQEGCSDKATAEAAVSPLARLLERASWPKLSLLAKKSGGGLGDAASRGGVWPPEADACPIAPLPLKAKIAEAWSAARKSLAPRARRASAERDAAVSDVAAANATAVVVAVVTAPAPMKKSKGSGKSGRVKAKALVAALKKGLCFAA